MARPCKKRRICGKPICNCFTPQEAGSYESVVMNLDEYECIRLIDYEGLEQEQCSEQMGVSRATVQAIYKSAREKMADAVINAKELHIEGGNIAFCEKMSFCKRQHCFAEKEKIYMEKKGGIEMRIAVTYENGEVFGHFGHTEQFKLYDVKEGKIQSEAILDSNGSGHGALATLLADHEVDVLICGGIGGGAQMALKDAGIKLYGGVSGIAYGFGCGRTEAADGHIALLEVGEVLLQSLHTAGAEEDEHVIVEWLIGLEVIAHRAVHHATCVTDVLGSQLLRDFILVYIAQGNEVLLVLMLVDDGQQAVVLACGAEEDLALAVLHVLLYIECDHLGNAEILHVFGDGDAKLAAEIEEMVHCVA